MRIPRSFPSARRQGPRALCAIATAAALAAAGPGCAVGFERASPAPRQAPRGAPSPLGWDRVTIVAGQRDSFVAGLERVLGERGVREISFAKARPAAQDGTIVEVAARSHTSALSTASLLLSLFTLSAFPGYGVSHHQVALTVHHPGAAPRTFDYRYRDAVVSWLPLALFGPDFVMGVNGGWQREDPHIAVRLEIARRFADDAAGSVPVTPPPPTANDLPGS
jgi:hypothetical protein